MVDLLDGRWFLQASGDPLRAHPCALNLQMAFHSLLPLDPSPWSHGPLAEGSRLLPKEPFESVVFWVWLASASVCPPWGLWVVPAPTQNVPDASATTTDGSYHVPGRYSPPRLSDLPLLCPVNAQLHLVVGSHLETFPSLRGLDQTKPGPPRPLESTGGFGRCPPVWIL